jgi:hypothetical protein
MIEHKLCRNDTGSSEPLVYVVNTHFANVISTFALFYNNIEGRRKDCTGSHVIHIVHILRCVHALSVQNSIDKRVTLTYDFSKLWMKIPLYRIFCFIIEILFSHVYQKLFWIEFHFILFTMIQEQPALPLGVALKWWMRISQMSTLIDIVFWTVLYKDAHVHRFECMHII